jgi:hypothetical protein
MIGVVVIDKACCIHWLSNVFERFYLLSIHEQRSAIYKVVFLFPKQNNVILGQ